MVQYFRTRGHRKSEKCNIVSMKSKDAWGKKMAVSYNGLWKLLIDKNMKKVDLINKLGISSSTIAKMTKGETVSMSIMEKLCEELDCDFGDIMHYEKGKAGENDGV